MRVYFARHGETDWNVRRWVQGRTDTELNDSGRRQAQRLAESLARTEEPIVCVYTSEMRRACATAQIVADGIGVECIPRPGLQEISLGDWEGHTWRQIERGWPEDHARWEANKRVERPPKGESYEELLGRFIPAVMKIVREARGDVLIVSHSACILAFQAELNRTPLERMIRDYAAPNAEAIALDAEALLARWPSEA